MEMLVDRPVVGPSRPGEKEKVEVTPEPSRAGVRQEDRKDRSVKVEPSEQGENDGRHGRTRIPDGAEVGEPESPRSGSEAETIVLPGANGDFSPAKRRILQHRDQDGVDEQKALERAAPPVKQDDGSRKADRERKGRKTDLAPDTVKDEETSRKNSGYEVARPGGRGSAPSSPGGDPPPARQASSTRILAPPDSQSQSRNASDPDRRSHEGRPAVGERSVSEAARRSSTASRGKKTEARRASHHSARPPLPEPSSSNGGRPPKRAASTQSTSRHPSEGIPKRRKLPSLLVDVPHAPMAVRAPSGDCSSPTSPRSPDASRPPQQPHRPQQQQREHQPSNTHRTTATESSLTSPVKMPFWSKLGRDHNGRTRLARACDLGELNNARLRLEERPDDVDVADHAGNTPLQIASLHGYVEIVDLLIAHGAKVNCTNNDKDTPLIDAVENRHIEVVRRLLAAGAEPNQRKVSGERPMDLLDVNNASDEEFRIALKTATDDRLRRASQDHSAAATNVNPPVPAPATRQPSRDALAANPRPSPTAGLADLISPVPPTTGRRRNVRTDATRNDLLWMSTSRESLRDRAGKGDMPGVGTILEVLQTADVESLIVAARGGHDEVMQLLLGIGHADADPEPLSSYQLGFNTPMLAAIGGGNEKVIQLLLSQPSFDPTRKDHRGKTYYEIAEERQGPGWQVEQRILKEAYDNAVNPKVEGSGAPGLPTSSVDDGRHEVTSESREHADPSHSSPRITDRLDAAALAGNHEAGNHSTPDAQERAAANTGLTVQDQSRSRKASRSNTGARGQTMGTSTRRSTSTARSPGQSVDASAATTETPVTRPRRKLVSGRELSSRERQQRRPSRSPRSSRTAGPRRAAETGSTGTRAGRSKRRRRSSSPRSSPPRSDSSSRASVERAQQKRRKLTRGQNGSVEAANAAAGDDRAGPEGRLDQTRSMSGVTSPDDTTADVVMRDVGEGQHDGRVVTSGDHVPGVDAVNGSREEGNMVEAGGAKTTGESVTVNSTNADILLFIPDTSHPTSSAEEVIPSQATTNLSGSGAENTQQAQTGSHRGIPTTQKPTRDPAQDKAEQEQKQAERKAEEERKRAEEEREKQKQAEQAERDRKAREAEEKRVAEERRKAREAEEKRVAEEQRKAEVEKQEQEARVRQAEEQRRQEAEMARRRAEQEEREREEARQRRAAQEARERAEQQERERVEQQAREREREQAELARRERLPFVLKRLAEMPTQAAQTVAEAQRHLPLYVMVMSEGGQDQSAKEVEWMCNVQAALILGFDDLALSNFSTLARQPVTPEQRSFLWHAMRVKLQDQDALRQGGLPRWDSDTTTVAKFLTLQPLFWIKVDDFLGIVPQFPHLQGLEMARVTLAGFTIFPVSVGGYGGVMDGRESALPLENTIDIVWRRGWQVSPDGHPQQVALLPFISQSTTGQPATNGTSQGPSGRTGSSTG